jgi:hypothetical protein
MSSPGSHHSLPRPSGTPRKRLAVLVAAAALVVSIACDGSSPTAPRPEGTILVRIDGTAESFRVQITDPQVLAEAGSLIGLGPRKIVGGRLVRGDGGFNQPWSWHLDPSSIVISDAAIEVCDGRPSDIESDLDYWIDTVRQYCPWGSEVVARVR